MPAECETICRSEAIVHKYIDDVLSGDIPACKYLKLACQRHLNDLENAGERGLYFDPEAGQSVIDFIEMLRHSKGKWAGRNFILEPWQHFIFWVLFGWMNEDGTRRFTVAYEEIARKNGKSSKIAGIGLYGLGFDGEGGAEIYSVATKEEQARITFAEGQSMTKKSGYLGGLAKIHTKAISIEETDSSWKPLGKNSKTQDGLNPHMVLVDEFHEHPDRSVLDVMDSAVGARSQPLLFIITTAGFNVQSACYLERDYAIKVLEGIIEDDSYFAVIYTLDRDEATGELIDDWADPEVWIKANPNLGVSVYKKDMERMCRKAQNDPAVVNNFLTKRLNVWTTQVTRYFNIEKWNACVDTVTEEELLGKPCFMGIDLASKEDICAIVCVFPWRDGKIVIYPKFFCPRDGAIERSRKHRVPYLVWSEQGYLSLSGIGEVDYEDVEKNIKALCEKFDVKHIGFDSWNSAQMRQNLIKSGMREDFFIKVPQTTGGLTEATKKLKALVNDLKVIHNNNPIMRWMASNTAIHTDGNENVKPMKNKSSEKIDGIVATIMALGLYLVERDVIDREANLREVGI
ncbi:MAG: terminase large subunit [Sedimentisphaerales bacterium]|nr:terminase large subunit [Sedimentisphaerales bacterium]